MKVKDLFYIFWL